MRAEKVIERGNRTTPREAGATRQPFDVLVDHRVNYMDERLIAIEETVATGQEIAFQPPLAEVLRQHLHHSAIRGEMIVANNCFSSPCAISDLEDRRQPVG